MELSTEYVGRRCRPLDIELTPRQTMNFAAGTADPNPCYFDDERPGGIIAPPMLATALTWKISSQMAQFQEADDFPAKVLTRQVHFTEILTCHRPMCPGGRLRIEGEVKAILPQRGGTHLVMEYRATGADGQPVFTEYVGALLRGVRCMGAAKGGENLPVPPASPPEKGLLWAKELHIGPLDAHIYDACGDIHFPIHTSPAFAHAVGLPGTIYHGTGTLSQINYTSRLDTYTAFSSINFLRGSTCSPISVVRVRSASTASSRVTCIIMRVSGFMVVSQS